MSAPKTVPTKESVEDFIASVADERRRADAEELCELMTKATGTEPVMWGPAIIGFGSTHYRYATGREGDMPAVGFSPRKAALTLYLAIEAHAALMAKLGPHTTSKACVYVKRLSDVDKPTLRKIVQAQFKKYNGKTLAS
ncbi:DUF1801 domain-containing protein [Actinophytocola sp.]|uniref:DUF1801 domain-containing protein n=1 Tax=Actinophytocola sp. TaxID=1872138 RepID=UPI002D80846F|nr:DUF1801 domain-containing protein [Actinophytocola sp.]HET9138804.1 DUF1801 domain-containing protein [Actinophytocola sp.]